MPNDHSPNMPDGPYVGLKWLDVCQDGEALTQNHQAPTPIAIRAVAFEAIDWKAIDEFTKLTRRN